MTKVISILNQKGGVGKTTTTVNLAAGLTRLGKKVLAIDLDAQGNLTSCFGIEPDTVATTVSDILLAEINDESYAPSLGVIHTEEGVCLLPSNIRLAGLEMQLITATSREYLLKSYISSLDGLYDFILIDCPPSLSVITINALAASDGVIVPVQAQHLAALGLTQLLKTVASVRRKINRRLEVFGLLITMYDARTKMSRAIKAVSYTHLTLPTMAVV